MNVDVKIEFNSIDRLLRDRGLEERGRVQQYVDSEFIRLASPYVPLRTGMLMKSATTGSVIGSGLVVYNVPYASAQYYGPRKTGSATGPLRGPYWAQRMISDHGDEIVRGAATMAGGTTK